MKKILLPTFFVCLLSIAKAETELSTDSLMTASSNSNSNQNEGAKAFAKNFADIFLYKKKHVIDTSSAEPFTWGDFTWLNGNDRRHNSALATKYFTGDLILDINYTASNHHPIDNTVVGSTALSRNNEVTVAFAGFGGTFNYNNVRGRLLTQFGLRSTVVPRNDGSVSRGQYNLDNALRYISEAYGGYHFNAMHGINLDAGIFMSYVGLFSYNNFENWAYQPSYTSDNTPWFFNGLRLQMFPTTKLKVEVWLINGWQTYGKFNNMPGIGSQILYRPYEWLCLLTNNYVGTDVANNPKCVRFHSDNSIEVRYYNNPNRFFTKAAFSFTGDFGFQSGGGFGGFGAGVFKGPLSNFISGMLYNRVWFFKNHFAWTFGGGYMHNPGRYLVLLPTGPATTGAAGITQFTANPGDPFEAWDCSTTFDWMPDELITFRIEVVHREANVPYFAGHGGVTSPDGYTTTPLTPGWQPDFVKSETRFVAALLLHF